MVNTPYMELSSPTLEMLQDATRTKIKKHFFDLGYTQKHLRVQCFLFRAPLQSLDLQLDIILNPAGPTIQMRSSCCNHHDSLYREPECTFIIGIQGPLEKRAYQRTKQRMNRASRVEPPSSTRGSVWPTVQDSGSTILTCH